MLKILNRTSDILDRASRIVAVPMMASFFLLILLGVFTRFVLRRPMLGISDYSTTSFVWSCFLGASILVKRKEHIAISGFVGMLPDKARSLVSLLMEIIELAFFVFVLVIGILVSRKVHVTRMMSTGMPMSVLYSALPYCMFSCAIHSSANLTNRIFGRSSDAGASEKGSVL